MKLRDLFPVVIVLTLATGSLLSPMSDNTPLLIAVTLSGGMGFIAAKSRAGRYVGAIIIIIGLGSILALHQDMERRRERARTGHFQHLQEIKQQSQAQ